MPIDDKKLNQSDLSPLFFSVTPMTQSRLSLLLFDKTTNALLNKIPVYSEMGVIIELPPYTIDHQLEFKEKERQLQNWFAGHNFVFNSIKNIIAANVSEDDFNTIADKNQFFISILAKIKDNLNDADSEEDKQKLISKIVLRALEKLDIAIAAQTNTKTLFSIPLGTLASDHAGYLSFDLTNAVAKLQNMMQGIKPLSTDVAFFVYPLGLETLKIDVLRQARVTPEVIFGKLPITLPGEYNEIKNVNLPAMHNPSLEDWYLSPGSFAINPAFFIGANGCENLFPANFSTHEFSFFQIIRGNKILIEARDVDDHGAQLETKLEVRTGWSLEYNVSWQPLGHTVGQIVYSLPLAPGETVKIAVIDWSRRSIDSRNEDLTVKEQLVHNTHRDRNISETVDAAMQEWQRGGSFMGGIAGSYGGGGYGISGALGGGYSTSSGNRNVQASTVQQISDAFAQASSSVRELRSTIVVQSEQQEKATAETRVVANHNHSHALTMLYYEVLRHYKVATQFMRVRPTLLVQQREIDFRSLTNIIRYRKILESVLMDGRFSACFDAAQKLQCLTNELERKRAQAALMPNLNDANELGEIKLVIKTQKAVNGHVFVFIVTKNREEIGCQVISPLWHKDLIPTLPLQFKDSLPNSVDDPSSITINANYRQDGQDNVFKIKPFRTVLWDDVEGLMIKIQFSSGTPWIIESIQATSANGGAPVWVMLDKKEVISIPVESQKLFLTLPYKEIPAKPEDLLTEDERCCIEKLKNHLVDNSFHYKKAIWLQEDPNARANRFKGMKTSDGFALIDLIDNRPIDVLGDYVVFPSRKSHENTEEFNALERFSVEKLMTLPTRGVFAEAKLGHCNASEIIDNTRFWDWQTSPITEEAPGIDNLNINDSRNAAPNLTPTQLPSSIVNIVNPPSLPDPTGMAKAMELLGKSDIFRDMSVSKEVEDLLEKLSDNSVGIAEAANKAKEINDKREKQKEDAKNSPAGNNSTGSAGGANLTPQQFMDWMNAVKNSDLPQRDKKDILQDVKEGAKQTVNPPKQQAPALPKTKDKRFVFQAVDYKNNNIQFRMQVTVFDILADKVAFTGPFVGSGSTLIKFDSASPTISIKMVTDAANIILPFGTLSVPQINKQTTDLITVKDTQQIVTVTLKQLAMNYSVEEKTKEEAASTLAKDLGGKLGIDKVVAAELLAKDAKQTVTTKGGETLIKFDLKLPDGSYDLIIK